MATLRIYRSSAGSGKTHTLVSAYLQVALASPMRFQEILAVTFTNQATKEMKQRILTYLYDLAQDNNSPITEELLQNTGFTQPELQQKAQTLLSNILHHYDRFTVSTIDSFFQTIIRSFAQELGIPPSFRVELDQWAVLDQLIDELIHHADQDTQLQEWLVDFAEYKLSYGKTWYFKQELYNLGTALFKEDFLVKEETFTQSIQDKNRFTQFIAALKQTIASFENTLQAYGQAALETIEKTHLSLTDFAYGTKGVAGYLFNLQQKKSFAPTQRARNATTKPSAWYSKNSTHQHLIEQLVQKHLGPILQQAIIFYDDHHQHYYTALAIQHFIYGLGMISYLKEHLQAYRTQKNVMLISDTTHLLRQIIADNETPFIYEKLGTYYKHFLIDEFQDISGFQWHNLKPLINNGLAEGYSSLLVGDVKQSIYRWRGGNWRLLLNHLTAEIPNATTINLDRNWRSGEHIVAFNNTFFSDASLAITNYLQAEIQALNDASLKHKLNEQIKQIASAYQDVAQSIPANTLQADTGYVRVALLKNQETATGDKFSWQEQVKQRLPTLIESLQDDGYALSDIALLVRNNAEGRTLFQTLLAYQQSDQAKPNYQYQAVSAESLYLGHNPWVNILINALQYLSDSDDALAKAELMHLYYTYISKKNAPFDYSYWHTTNQEKHVLPKEFFDEWNTLQALPLYERITALIPIFGLDQSEMIPFIQAFLDVVLSYLQEEAAGIHSFLTWWHKKGAHFSLPRMQGQEAISIMTIHQSKGLQFKVVILPFCDWNFDHSPQNPPIIWCESTVEPFAQLPILPLRYNKSLQDTLYARAYYEEKMQAYLDNLNLLYVAFTRPEDRLYVFAPQPNKPALKSIVDLLLHVFTQTQPASQLQEKQVNWESCWDANQQTLTLGKLKPVNKINPIQPTVNSMAFLYHNWHHQLTNAINTTNSISCIQANIYEYMTTILIHLPKAHLLEQHIAYLQQEQGLDQDYIYQIAAYIKALWQNPTIKAWYENDWLVQPKASLLAPGGQVYQVDRLMTQGDQATAIYFINSGRVEEKNLQATREILKQMHYQNIQVYLLNLTSKTLYSF